MQQKRPLVLMILDGWGYSDEQKHNAIAQANTPQWDEWWQTRPHKVLQASGHDVGLPDEQMGNSEVGHMHIGSGRIIQQDFTRINAAIEKGEFASNAVFLNMFESLKKSGRALHIMGLLSDGGVHSHQKHLFSFLQLAHEHNFANIFLHLFLDGRDTSPQSALTSINALEQQLKNYPVAQIVSISGRYFAMDRDKRWERVAPVYRLLTEAISTYQFADAKTAITTFYQENKNDEFIPPSIIGEGKIIEEGDAIFFFNFRADRARQLTQAFIDDDFNGFLRPQRPLISQFITMTRYAKNLNTEVVFPAEKLKNTLGEIIANEGMSQLRIAETEKYAHVTFFFNGGVEQPFDNEERILIPSPYVNTYDLLPQMSAPELTRALIDAIKSAAFDVIICNYANADMVGHTGDFEATIKAIECLDDCMSKVWEALSDAGGALLITADHGNAEEMYDEKTAQAHTAHTCEPVPLLYIGGDWQMKTNTSGTLIDVAPTMLALLNLKKPQEMTGESLLVRNNAEIR